MQRVLACVDANGADNYEVAIASEMHFIADTVLYCSTHFPAATLAPYLRDAHTGATTTGPPFPGTGETASAVSLAVSCATKSPKSARKVQLSRDLSHCWYLNIQHGLSPNFHRVMSRVPG